MMNCQEVGKNLHKRVQEKEEEEQRKSKHNEEKKY